MSYTWGKGKLYIGTQFRFPRSKKRRIQKKWKNDKRNWKWGASVGNVLNFTINRTRLNPVERTMEECNDSRP